jgi:hypothetical protein
MLLTKPFINIVFTSEFLAAVSHALLFLIYPASFPYNRILLGHKSEILAGHQWLTPVILATQEAEIRRGNQPRVNR